jgi:hypothetical protein
MERKKKGPKKRRRTDSVNEEVIDLLDSHRGMSSFVAV